MLGGGGQCHCKEVGKVPLDWTEVSAALIFKNDKEEDLENYRHIRLTLIPRKLMDQVILETISKYTKDKKVTASKQHGFKKGKAFLSNLIVLYNEIAGFVGEAWAVDVAYFNLSKAFDTISRNIFIDKAMKYRLDKWTVRWTEDCLSCCSQRVVITGTKSR